VEVVAVCFAHQTDDTKDVAPCSLAGSSQTDVTYLPAESGWTKLTSNIITTT
jgi:hypothetical protein